MKQTPQKYQLVGSNDAVCDEKAHWEVLCQDLSGIPTKSFAERRFCKVRVGNMNYCPMFRCVGIKVLQNGGGWYVSLGGIRLWAYDSIRIPNS